MTDPSQYFKGRTVQEQMTEVIGYVDTRAGEVAVDAIASDVAQVHQDMLDADADASAAAASAAAAAGTLANAVKKTGEASQSIAGDIDISGALSVSGAVTVPAPTGNTDAATKKYVDDQDATKISITDVNQYAVGLTGNQNPIAGDKTWGGVQILENFARCKHKVLNTYSVTTTLGRWVRIYEIDRSGQTMPQADFLFNFRINGFALAQVRIVSGILKLHGLISGNTRTPENLLRASTEDDSKITIWAYMAMDDGIRSDCISAYGSNSQMAGSNITVLSETTGYNISSSGYTDENNITHTFTRYSEMNQ